MVLMLEAFMGAVILEGTACYYICLSTAVPHCCQHQWTQWILKMSIWRVSRLPTVSLQVEQKELPATGWWEDLILGILGPVDHMLVPAIPRIQRLVRRLCGKGTRQAWWPEFVLQNPRGGGENWLSRDNLWPPHVHCTHIHIKLTEWEIIALLGLPGQILIVNHLVLAHHLWRLSEAGCDEFSQSSTWNSALSGRWTNLWAGSRKIILVILFEAGSSISCWLYHDLAGLLDCRHGERELMEHHLSLSWFWM